MSDDKQSLVPVKELRAMQQTSDWYEGSRLARAAVASIPWVGGAIDQVLAGGATARGRERIDAFVIDVDTQLRALKGQLAAVTDPDAMIDLARLVLTRVATARTAEKRARFVNILVHQALIDAHVDDAEAAVDLLD